MNTYAHWSKLSSNPISPEVMEHVKKHLQEVHSGPYPGNNKLFDTYIKGMAVLDIGIVEHDLSFVDRPSWKHAQLKECASSIIGIDILKEEIEILKNKGFDVRFCDATSDADLGQRFDIVYIGDVIEHVNDPVRLLQFAARHIKPDGKILVTTPCPFWWRNIALMIKDQTYIGNVDHTFWVTPVNALELGYRSDLYLSHYYTHETHGNTRLKKIIKWLLEKLLGKTEIFTWAYIYVFTKHPPFDVA